MGKAFTNAMLNAMPVSRHFEGLAPNNRRDSRAAATVASEDTEISEVIAGISEYESWGHSLARATRYLWGTVGDHALPEGEY